LARSGGVGNGAWRGALPLAPHQAPLRGEGLDEGGGHLPAKAGMRAFGVAGHAPGRARGAGRAQGREQRLVQELVAYTLAIKRQIDMEEQDRATMAASGARGFFAGAVAMVIDPMLWVLVLLVAKSAKKIWMLPLFAILAGTLAQWLLGITQIFSDLTVIGVVSTTAVILALVSATSLRTARHRILLSRDQNLQGLMPDITSLRNERQC
jgi:hypothetical protein